VPSPDAPGSFYFRGRSLLGESDYLLTVEKKDAQLVGLLHKYTTVVDGKPGDVIECRYGKFVYQQTRERSGWFLEQMR
jgi:hypothetical protein